MKSPRLQSKGKFFPKTRGDTGRGSSDGDGRGIVDKLWSPRRVRFPGESPVNLLLECVIEESWTNGEGLREIKVIVVLPPFGSKE